MNVEHKKIFIAGLQAWYNKLMIRENDLISDSKSDKISPAMKIDYEYRVEKIQLIRFNIKQEMKMQKDESKHYIGV